MDLRMISTRHNNAIAHQKFKKILLIKLSAFGDVIHTLPLYNALRRQYPSAQIDWLTKPSNALFLRDYIGIENVLVYGENHTEAPQYNWDGITHFGRLIKDQRFLNLLKRLRTNRYDLVIDMQGQMRSGFLSLVTGAPVRMGFDRPRKKIWAIEGKILPAGSIERAWKGAREGAWLAYTHPIVLSTLSRHPIDRNLLAAEMLGIHAQQSDHQIVTPPLPPRSGHSALDEWLAAVDKPIILITPGTLWETKHWLEDNFAAVARHFLQSGYSVVLTGEPNQKAKLDRISEAAPGAEVLNTTLSEMAGLMRHCALILTNDSGPLHLATALGRTAIAIFGPTNPNWVGPYRRPNLAISAKRPCSPCFLRNLSRCNFSHACMTEIKSEQVIRFMEDQLARSGGVGNQADNLYKKNGI
jgi:ADP-heptose:LPS heptosyltransferase